MAALSNASCLRPLQVCDRPLISGHTSTSSSPFASLWLSRTRLSLSHASALKLTVSPLTRRGSQAAGRRSPIAMAAVDTSIAADASLQSSKTEEVRAVLFDMDGVLCNSEDISRDAAVALFAEMGVKVTPSDFIPFLGTGEANFLGGVARLYEVKDFDPVKAKARFFEIYIEQYAKPNSGLGYKGALELIEECKATGLKIAVASSADRVKVDANLSASGLPQSKFDAIVSADKFENLKPAPDIFLAAAALLGVPPSQCVVIEDALAGVQAATSAGMRSIAVTTTLGAQSLREGKPALIKTDISDIKLDDILSLKYPNDTSKKNGSNGSSLSATLSNETSIGSPTHTETDSKENTNSLLGGGGLDSPLVLPGGLMTTRRNVLRSASLVGGLGSTLFALTHSKALSYVSPKAIINALVGVAGLPSSTNEGEARITELKQYIADLDRRGGGAQVPEFESQLDWLNTAPLSMNKELKGKLVLLDFWTYCCINCMHVLPDLAFLEKKYSDKPVVVVGVHSAKFDNEKDLEAIRQAVLRYDVVHPVVNDGEMTMWRKLGVSSWPTLALVSPSGRLIAMLAGEGHREDLDDLLSAALQYYGEKGELNNSPLPVALEKNKDGRLLASPLRFPGKITTDLANGRLFISDSNHHRIVVTDLEGRFLLQVGGAGGEGFRNGSFETAAFNRPQGMAYDSTRNVLYVADTENHALREINFVSETVSTLAGDGTKGQDYKGGRSGTSQVLNSPWDVAVDKLGQNVYIAIAGQHQIWRHDVETGVTSVFSGNGYERNQNGQRGTDTAYAQPSGLSFDPEEKELYVADSESSSIRAVNLATGGSRLCAGGDPNFSDNLFQFGDRDGVGSRAQLQHPLGVLYGSDGKLYIADSYNHKMKVMDPRTLEVVSLVGTGVAGFKEGRGKEAQLSEPAGLAEGLNGQIYIADTNNSVIRILDTRADNLLSTLDLSSVPLPSPSTPSSRRRLRKRQPVDAEVVELDPISAQSGKLELLINIPEGYHYTKGAVSRFEVEVEPDESLLLELFSGTLEEIGLSSFASLRFSRKEGSELPAAVQVNCKVFYCQQDEVCLYKAITFKVPFASPAAGKIEESITLPFTIVPRPVNVSSLITK